MAQVDARKAEAAFSKSTNERWRDSPKGVVSEQERESKKADYQSSELGCMRPMRRSHSINRTWINTAP